MTEPKWKSFARLDLQLALDRIMVPYIKAKYKFAGVSFKVRIEKDVNEIVMSAIFEPLGELYYSSIPIDKKLISAAVKGDKGRQLFSQWLKLVCEAAGSEISNMRGIRV